MSLLEQPRGRAQSIPGALAETYSHSPSSSYATSTPDVVDRDCSADDCSSPAVVAATADCCRCSSSSSSSSSSLDSSADSLVDSSASTTAPEPASRSCSPHHLDDDDDDMLPVPRPDALAGPAPPALPAKSALRTSRLLASLAQKTAPEDRPILPHAAPHQVYLSSEEDASSSADDLSDLDELDWEAGDSQKPPSVTRSAREDTARVVTVVFHGRPSLVDLPPRASYAGSTDSQRLATGLLRTATEPTLTCTRSNSPTSMAMYNPPRSSSMTPSGFQMKRRQFLTVDPFATKLPDLDEQDVAKTPKTPTGMLKKTLSLVKKRSRPNLHPVTGPSRENVAAQTTPMEQVGEEPEPEAPRQPSPVNRSHPPVTYQTIMQHARRSAETSKPDLVSPVSTPSRSRFRSGLSISRPRSVRT